MNENLRENKPSFVYVTYIRTTPEKLWEALTSGDFSEKYWFGFRIEGEWREGGALRVRAPEKLNLKDTEGCNQDIIGEVLACDPPKKLVYTFGNHETAGTPQKRSGPSRVTYEIKQMGPMVRFRLVHEDLVPADIEPNPDKWQGVNNGWPAILSSLKSLLETGEAITFRE